MTAIMEPPTEAGIATKAEVERVFQKMERLRVNQVDVAKEMGAYTHSLTNFRQGVFEMSRKDCQRLDDVCEQIARERLESGGQAHVAAAR